MGSDDYCSISIITARACTEIRKKRRSETCTRSFTTCISPRLIFSRWFERNRGAEKVNREKHLQYGSRNNQKKKKKKKEEDSLTEFDIKSSSTALEDPGGDKKADSLNLGIGFGLIYLFNATKNELNKIVEIRREMEILLHNSKMEFQKQARIISNSRAKCDSDCLEQFAYSTDIEEKSEITCSHDHTAFNCKSMKGNGRELEMDQLEAELEVELERLQFHVDLKYPTQRNAEIMDGYSSGEGSLSTSPAQVYNPNSCATTIANCGVPAEELKRRLHELIQTRQEERIKELESALESTMQKLAEKEKEVCWWRDTAKVISQHAPTRRSLTKLG